MPTEAARMSYGVARPLSRPTHGEHHNHVRAHAAIRAWIQMRRFGELLDALVAEKARLQVR